jgi:peroxiredoxin
MPHFNEVYQESREQVVFLMVDLIDEPEKPRAKKGVCKRQNFSFPIYFDSQLSAAQAFGVGLFH